MHLVHCMELVLGRLRCKMLLIYLDGIINGWIPGTTGWSSCKCGRCSPKTETIQVQAVANWSTLLPRMMDAVRAWETPKNSMDIQRFLGLCDYYWRFVPRTLQITWPILSLISQAKILHSNGQQRHSNPFIHSRPCCMHHHNWPASSLTQMHQVWQ